MQHRRLAWNGLIALCLGLLSCTLVAGGTSVTRADRLPWIEAQSPHFHFFSTESEASTRRIARDFETLRYVLQSISAHSEAAANTSMEMDTVPNFVYLFSRESAFESYRTQKWMAGWFTKRTDGNYIALRTDLEGAEHIVFHEYVHMFMHQNNQELPAWLDEGLAEFYSTMQVDGNEIQLGTPKTGEFITLQTGSPMPLDRLLNEAPALHTTGSTEVARFYATAWLFVHYCIAGNPERNRQLGNFFNLLMAKVPAQEAFGMAFQGSTAQLDRELATYVKQCVARKAIPIRKLTFTNLKVEASFSSHPLAQDQVQARLGLLAISGSPDSKHALARAHFDAALALQPSCAPALFGQSLLQLFEGNYASSAPFLEKAAQVMPEDGMAQILAGEALYAKGTELANANTPFPPELAQARLRLLAGLKHNPSNLQAYRLVVQINFQDSNSGPEAVTFLEEAMRKFPQDPEFPFELANLLLRRQDTARASALLNQIASQPGPNAEQAKRLLAEIADQEASAMVPKAIDLANNGKPSEAVVILERALSIAQTKPMRDRIQKVLDQARAMVPPPVAPQPTGKKKAGKAKS